MLGMMGYTCNLSTPEAESEGLLRVQSQPSLHSKTLSGKKKDAGEILSG